jgi:hypothetical protein
MCRMKWNHIYWHPMHYYRKVSHFGMHAISQEAFTLLLSRVKTYTCNMHSALLFSSAQAPFCKTDKNVRTYMGLRVMELEESLNTKKYLDDSIVIYCNFIMYTVY